MDSHHEMWLMLKEKIWKLNPPEDRIFGIKPSRILEMMDEIERNVEFGIKLEGDRK